MPWDLLASFDVQFQASSNKVKENNERCVRPTISSVKHRIISERRDELCCGVGVVDLMSGRSVATFQFLSGVEEIFAVDVIPNHRHPVFGGASHDEQQQEVWVVPASAANVTTKLH